MYTYAMSEKDSKDRHNAIVLKPGNQHLNGEEALAVARTRKQDNDIERGKRQQQLIEAMIKKAASIGSLNKMEILSKLLAIITKHEFNVQRNAFVL